MEKNAKIYVAGHGGLVGSALVRQLQVLGYDNLLVRKHGELDLTDQAAVHAFFGEERPRYVFLAAAKVGGIVANNTFPADFIYQNLMIEANVIHSAYLHGTERLLFLGSSCIYPKLAEQPMAEDALLTGALEPTNEPYAIAKIAGIKMCESYNRQYGTDFRSVMPTNLYGPGDNYHLENSHVIPALIRKFHEAKVNADSAVTVWGSGTAKREFLYVDDMADACIHVMKLPRDVLDEHTAPMRSHINVGSGQEVTIRQLSEVIKDVVGYDGDVVFDTDKPDGAPRKLLDNSLLASLSWKANTDLRAGLTRAYEDFASASNLRASGNRSLAR